MRDLRRDGSRASRPWPRFGRRPRLSGVRFVVVDCARFCYMADIMVYNSSLRSRTSHGSHGPPTRDLDELLVIESSIDEGSPSHQSANCLVIFLDAVYKVCCTER